MFKTAVVARALQYADRATRMELLREFIRTVITILYFEIHINSMQNTGAIKGDSTKTPEEFEDTQGIKRDLRGIQHRHSISQIFLRKRTNPQPPAELPSKEELNERIDNIFKHSEKTQPSKKVNIGASVADSTSILLSSQASNGLIGLIGISASEIIAFMKNGYDRDAASKLRKYDLSKLESMEYDMLSNLQSIRVKKSEKGKVKEVEELIKETAKLFSDIEHKSKESLITALGSRVEGFAGSASALFLGLTVLKPAVDWVSSQIDLFAHLQPFQPPSYSPEFVFSILDFAAKGIMYVGASYTASYLWDLGYNELVRNRSAWKREFNRSQLKERAEELLDKIAEKCA